MITLSDTQTSRMAIHRYGFAPSESRLSLHAHVYPVWSNASRYQQETKASDTYWRHKLGSVTLQNPSSAHNHLVAEL